MKYLHDDYELMNDDGEKLASEIEQAIKPIIEKYINDGYNSHEIEIIGINSLLYLIAVARINRRVIKDRSPEAQQVEALG